MNLAILFPQKYYITQGNLETRQINEWQEIIKPTICNEKLRKKYD